MLTRVNFICLNFQSLCCTAQKRVYDDKSAGMKRRRVMLGAVDIQAWEEDLVFDEKLKSGDQITTDYQNETKGHLSVGDKDGLNVEE